MSRLLPARSVLALLLAVSACSHGGPSVHSAPSLAEQLNYIRTLYEEICAHYGLRIGLRHARKHLGWALQIAGRCSRAPALTLKRWRGRILTLEDPKAVQQSLLDAYDDFAWSAAA